MDSGNRAFGERLRAAREGLGLTQTQLALKLNVPQKQISVWESGQSKPGTYDRLRLLAQAVEATVGWLVDGEGKPPKHITKQGRDKLARAEREETKKGA